MNQIAKNVIWKLLAEHHMYIMYQRYTQLHKTNTAVLWLKSKKTKRRVSAGFLCWSDCGPMVEVLNPWYSYQSWHAKEILMARSVFKRIILLFTCFSVISITMFYNFRWHTFTNNTFTFTMNTFTFRLQLLTKFYFSAFEKLSDDAIRHDIAVIVLH